MKVAFEISPKLENRLEGITVIPKEPPISHSVVKYRGWQNAVSLQTEIHSFDFSTDVTILRRISFSMIDPSN